MTVQPADVRDTLGSTELSDSQLESFIGPAKRLYDGRTDGVSVDADRRDDVVTQLAAHIVATGPERQISSGGEGGGNVSFEGETGMGLEATTHGQIAITLDPTGKLAGSDKPRASVDVPDAKGIRD
jgi:hypothetical protein